MSYLIGTIQNVDYQKALVNATFEGADDYVRENIQVKQQNNRSFRMPKVGDIGIFLTDEQGMIYIGSVCSESHSPSADRNILILEFEENVLTIDPENKTISIDTEFDISAKCKSFSAEATENITVKAKKIILDGEVEATKNIKASIDIKAGTISLLNHLHNSSAPGSPTGPSLPGGV